MKVTLPHEELKIQKKWRQRWTIRGKNDVRKINRLKCNKKKATLPQLKRPCFNNSWTGPETREETVRHLKPSSSWDSPSCKRTNNQVLIVWRIYLNWTLGQSASHYIATGLSEQERHLLVPYSTKAKAFCELGRKKNGDSFYFHHVWCKPCSPCMVKIWFIWYMLYFHHKYQQVLHHDYYGENKILGRAFFIFTMKKPWKKHPNWMIPFPLYRAKKGSTVHAVKTDFFMTK